jgi:predicted nucleotidyltransferase
MRSSENNTRTVSFYLSTDSLSRIKAILSKHKRDLASRYHIKEIGIFGSYLRNEQRKGSDIDLLVEFKTVPGLLGFIGLENELEGLLGSKVDLVRKGALRKELKRNILSEVVYV